MLRRTRNIGDGGCARSPVKVAQHGAAVDTFAITPGSRMSIDYDKLKKRITPWSATRSGPAREIGKKSAAWIERWNKEIGH